MSRHHSWLARLSQVGLVLGMLLLAPIGPVPQSALAATPAAPVTPPAQPANDRLYLGESGHIIESEMLTAWQAGGLPAFGYPLTEAFDDRCQANPCRVQYFERARIEVIPATGQHMLGLLGLEYLNGRTFTPETPFVSSADRWYFPETGQGLGFGFLHYWLHHDGPYRLGLPVSPEFDEEGRTVQYFERGRLDYFADRDPLARIEVAPLGSRVIERRGWLLPAIVDLRLSALSIPQGRPLAVAIRQAQAIQLIVGGETVAMSQTNGVWRGMVAIAPWAEIGERRLVVNLRASDGSERRLERRLQVVAYDFPRERLIVPPGQGELLDPAVRDRELAIVRPLYAIVTPEPTWQGRWRWPTDGPITTEFATRRAYNDGPFNEYHGGLDIGAPTGTPVVAPAAGRVVYAGPLAIRGNFVAIDHGLGLLSAYFHLSAITVSPGQYLQPGDLLGRVGSTGLSTGPHLHWEARIGGTPLDPRSWLSNELLP